MKKKIAVITGSRADYAHLLWLLKEIDADPELELQLIASGMHMAKEHGLSYKQIEEDGFRIAAMVDILKFGNSRMGVTRATGEGIDRFAVILDQLKPDWCVVLGDRFESFAFATAAYMARIPLAHIHGGEVTAGAVDEALRHSITKMSALHFAATGEYCRRIIQLGEDPRRVFHVGTPSLEMLKNQKIHSREELSRLLGFDVDEQTVLLTYHPATLCAEDPVRTLKMIVDALRNLKHPVIATRANTDAAGDLINAELERAAEADPERFHVFRFLGVRRYFSCLKHCAAMAGNSSSGLIEAPAFALPVVNIGGRQEGRVRGANVIDVKPAGTSIRSGLQKALSPRFRGSLKGMNNPYQRYKDGRVAARIRDKIKSWPVNDATFRKRFHDL